MNTRDHGGGVDAAVARWGGRREDWIDLSTGINPVPYPMGDVSDQAWTALPDKGAMDLLLQAARAFWKVPAGAAIVATAGASAPIVAIPGLWPRGRVCINGPTYNEHEAAFRANGWSVVSEAAEARVIVNPNNPDGRWFDERDLDAPAMVVDESFADVAPERSLIAQAGPGRIILKSFGKFWGLAGVRLGFAIGGIEEMNRLSERLGPWAVSGPALEIGARALKDIDWAKAARVRLAQDAARLDRVMAPHGALLGGTPLFRLFEVGNAVEFQERLAKQHIWSRVFPYSKTWIRLGLPAPRAWGRLEAAL